MPRFSKKKLNIDLTLYKFALATGIILTFTMVLALGMLSGITHPFNIFNYSERYSIVFVTIFACLGIVAVMLTVFYAIWGDRN